VPGYTAGDEGPARRGCHHAGGPCLQTRGAPHVPHSPQL